MKKNLILLLMTALIMILPGCKDDGMGVNDDSSVVESQGNEENLVRGNIYVIIDGVYYDIKNIELESVQENGITRYFYNGAQIDAFYTSEEDCIKAGAISSAEVK